MSASVTSNPNVSASRWSAWVTEQIGFQIVLNAEKFALFPFFWVVVGQFGLEPLLPAHPNIDV